MAGAKAIRRYKVVKKDGPEDLVFQSVKDGKPMRDNNVLKCPRSDAPLAHSESVH